MRSERLDGQEAVGAGAVLDHHGHAVAQGQVVGDQARQAVGPAAYGKGVPDAHGAPRKRHVGPRRDDERGAQHAAQAGGGTPAGEGAQALAAVEIGHEQGGQGAVER
jgi:hypothetical protein